MDVVREQGMSAAIETRGLTKSFGTVLAVDDLDLDVDPGEIFGFIGPNGAGKSTTIRLLLDELRPTSGTARVLGLDAHADMVDAHARIGYVPGELVVPLDVTGGDYLDFLAALRPRADHDWRRSLVERFDLDESRRLGQLSTGNRQKVGLVQAFMHRPDLVLLDEPTKGLDPLVQYEVHQLLFEVARAGTTVFLSSHTLSEVDRVADRVGIIRRGRLVAVDTVAALTSRARHRIELGFAAPAHLDELRAAAGVVGVEQRGDLAVVTFDGPVDELLRRAVDAGTVLTVRAPEADLDDVFLDYYRDEHRDGR